eukprot:77753_1
MDKLYQDWYKHGFAVDLDDMVFNKYYKMITHFEHVSVNYNRNIVNAKEKRETVKPTLQNKCTSDDTLDITQCTFIDYVIYALNLFEEMKANCVDFNRFDLSRLGECYTHIICVHSFCSNPEQRKEIKTYVCDMVGICKKGAQCSCIKQHSARRDPKEREEKENTESEWNQNDILYDVLLSCLNSLHCYLVHDALHLYRIRAQDGNAIDSDSRFSSVIDSNPLSFYDEIDEIIQFILCQSNANPCQWIIDFVEWLKVHQYDWDSLQYDIGCNTTKHVLNRESNVYSFLKQHKQQNLFAVLNERYAQKSTVGTLDFGVSVLRWFEYGFQSAYQSLSDEVCNNKFSPITLKILQTYHEQCKILSKSQETEYKYTLDELLSLKLYTDESKFTTLFRTAFWNNTPKATKREFYHWAITLYKACLYHSRPLPQCISTHRNAYIGSIATARPKTLYHGIDKIFANTVRAPKYNGPVSTTTTQSVAHQFSEGRGLLWSINTSYYNPFYRVTGIDVSHIARFKNEDEVLLNDQYIHITDTTHFANALEIKIDHLLSQLKVYGEEIIDCDLFWKQIGFEIDNEDHHAISHVAQHALLFQQSQYKPDTENQYKLILERLVEELHLSNVLVQYSITHPADIVDRKLHQLQAREQPITIADIIWKIWGNTVDDDPQLSMEIRVHPLLYQQCQYKHKLVLERVVEELGVRRDFELKTAYLRHRLQSGKFGNNDMLMLISCIPLLLDTKTKTVSNNDQLKVEYLLHQIQAERAYIADKNLFWQSIGFTSIDTQFVPLIKQHRLLKAETNRKHKTVLQRLVEELELFDFAEEYWKHCCHCIHFIDSLYVTSNQTIALTDPDGINGCSRTFSLFEFATTSDVSKSAYSFEDEYSFSLPITNINHVVNIFAKPMNTSFPFTRIKTIASDIGNKTIVHPRKD